MKLEHFKDWQPKYGSEFTYRSFKAWWFTFLMFYDFQFNGDNLKIQLFWIFSQFLLTLLFGPLCYVLYFILYYISSRRSSSCLTIEGTLWCFGAGHYIIWSTSGDSAVAPGFRESEILFCLNFCSLVMAVLPLSWGSLLFCGAPWASFCAQHPAPNNSCFNFFLLAPSYPHIIHCSFSLG